ncbi:hypothetical protein EJ03DRAFT_192905 [Teratosphaeria nubilosa]|uniref:Uncharacterized protein n=1 Tax=Teratosphaeria nubilosa TaxID=161662 RepID=A0A6G1L167_9PEZI|nr:hypothetical protein EJ03DRAFT_192905 [Teratosphaeria nubilosa]
MPKFIVSTALEVPSRRSIDLCFLYTPLHGDCCSKTLTASPSHLSQSQMSSPTTPQRHKHLLLCPKPHPIPEPGSSPSTLLLPKRIEYNPQQLKDQPSTHHKKQQI